jgi:hypothetical protein
MRSLRAAAVALVVTAGLGGAAPADVLYSNFAEGDAYDTTYGWTLSYGGPLGGDAYEDAVPFTVTGGDYAFDSAEVAVNLFYGPDLVYANLHADAGGVPGEILDSTSASGAVTPGTLGPPMVVDFGGDVILEDGRTYWLALRTEETDALMSWAFNIVDDFGLRAWQLNNGPWNAAMGIPGTDSERDVFRINGTPVSGCYADFTGDSTLDLFDFLAYVNAFNSGEDRADCSGEGALDLFDFLCFVNAFNEGC